MMKEFYIDDKPIRLHCKLDMPAEETKKCSLVIVIHGLTGHMEETHITAICKRMNELGFATLRAEMYGHGKSDGRFEDHNLFQWILNGLRVIDYARSLDFVTDLFIAGHSQGGLLTILLGGLRNNQFKAILPLSPATIIPDGAKTGRMLGMEFDPDNIPDRISIPLFDLNGDYLRLAQLIHPEDSVRKYHGKVLIVHGDEDEAIPVRYSEELQKMYDDCQLTVIHGDDHCYTRHLDQVLDAITVFLNRVR